MEGEREETGQSACAERCGGAGAASWVWWYVWVLVFPTFSLGRWICFLTHNVPFFAHLFPFCSTLSIFWTV